MVQPLSDCFVKPHETSDENASRIVLLEGSDGALGHGFHAPELEGDTRATGLCECQEREYVKTGASRNCPSFHAPLRGSWYAVVSGHCNATLQESH